jgi:uncharacterized protein YecT (DUF1311 family)
MERLCVGSGRGRILFLVVFCVLLLATWGIFQPRASGQETGHVQESGPVPESPVTPPEQTPSTQAPAPQYDKTIFQKPIPSDQLSFLSHFSGAMSGDVVRDKQYRKLMRSLVPDCIFHYGTDMSLSDAFGKVLEDSTLPVRIRDGRYFLVSGRSGPYLGGRGFTWIDMQDGVGLGGFYFRPTNGEPTPTVTIFSRQVREKSLALSQLPPAFAEDLGRWSSEARVPSVTTRYFIGGSNEKILLEHDEDYCSPADPTTASLQEACEQMNADAADMDVTAAYYLEQTHHATNATEWMIEGEDQVVWIRVRDETCGIGPDPLRCHIRMARERTRVIIHREPVPHVPRR